MPTTCQLQPRRRQPILLRFHLTVRPITNSINGTKSCLKIRFIRLALRCRTNVATDVGRTAGTLPRTKSFCILVQNQYDIDARVRRKAEALVGAGYSVDVLA